jgi:tetratricopeptide (TPR) repeat protein
MGNDERRWTPVAFGYCFIEISGKVSVAGIAKLLAIAWMILLLCPNDVSGALGQSSPSAKSGTQDETALRTAAEKAPDDFQRVNALGEYYLRNEKWRESVEWLSKAYSLSAGNESVGYDLSFALMQAGELESAGRQVEQLLIRSDSARLHNLLAMIADRRGDDLKAAKEYHRAAEIDPSESNVFDLATFLVQHKKYVGFVDEAIKFFRYGVAQYPRSSQMMVGLGVALYASQQYDEAVRVLCAAVDLDPTDRRPIEFLGKARRVSPELAREVDERLRAFAERYPDNAATSYYYAYSLWERGGGEEGKNLDKIEELLRRAEARAPAWYEPHYQLGVVYESEKRYPDAIREMQETAKIEPGFAPAHFRLAILYNRTGDKAKAELESRAVQRIKDQDRKSDQQNDAGK